MPRRGENIRKRKDGRWEARFPKEKNERGNTIYGVAYGSTYKEVTEKRRQLPENPPIIQNNSSDGSFGNLLTHWITDNKSKISFRQNGALTNDPKRDMIFSVSFTKGC